jgi:hypothetical protein
MIRVILSGRLGNVLFQYAAGRQLAIKNKTLLLLDLSENYQPTDIFAWNIQKALRCLRIQADIYNPFSLTLLHKTQEHTRVRLIRPREHIFSEGENGYNPEILKLGDGSTLKGYFQSWKYFEAIQETIRKEIQLENTPQDADILRYEEMIRSANSIAIHIRRKDYLQIRIYNFLGEQYYARTVKYFQDRFRDMRLFIFSDDPDWCMHNLSFPNSEVVKIGRRAGNPIADLYLMQQCKHQIISNSTFSWWGGWLNSHPDKIVVAPSIWCKTGNQTYDQNLVQNLLPASWVRMAVE